MITIIPFLSSFVSFFVHSQMFFVRLIYLEHKEIKRNGVAAATSKKTQFH